MTDIQHITHEVPESQLRDSKRRKVQLEAVCIQEISTLYVLSTQA